MTLSPRRRDLLAIWTTPDGHGGAARRAPGAPARL